MRTRSERTALRALAVGILFSLSAAACQSSGDTSTTEDVVRLSRPLVIDLSEAGGIALGTYVSGGNPVVGQIGGSIAAVVGTFAFDQVVDSIFTDDASFVIIHHLVDGEAKTSVIRIEDTSNLAIRVTGEATVYPFQGNRITFDALTETETEIIVFSLDAEDGAESGGKIPLPLSGQAFDLESETNYPVDDTNFMPQFVDIYFDEAERYGVMVNDAVAVARHGLPSAREVCEDLPDEVWRANLVPANGGEIDEKWCVITSEGSMGLVEVVDGNLEYKLWDSVE